MARPRSTTPSLARGSLTLTVRPFLSFFRFFQFPLTLSSSLRRRAHPRACRPRPWSRYALFSYFTLDPFLTFLFLPGAHGRFKLTSSIAEYTTAKVLTEVGVETPVFVRFSTVLGSNGAAETAREVRGFATKFYTKQGCVKTTSNVRGDS